MIYYSFEDIKPAYKISKITFRELEGIEKLRWSKGDNPNSFRYVIPETTLKLEKMKSRKIEGKEPIYNPESQPDFYIKKWHEQDKYWQKRALLQVEKERHTYSSSVINYRAYINSPEWKVKAEQRKARDRWHCAHCKLETHGLEVHHTSYDRLGHEDIETDLITLCHKCHEEFYKDHLKKIFKDYLESLGEFMI